MFNETETIEPLLIDTLKQLGWKYIPPKELNRSGSGVLLEDEIRKALIRLNPEIEANPDKAERVINDFRALVISVPAHDLVAYNEKFKKKVFQENSYPLGENGRHISVRLFGFGDDINKNSFIVTNQWQYPPTRTGKIPDIVLFINGFPMIIGEVKTATRNAITWGDGVIDMLDYENTIPQMFVSNIFNFATEGKCFRYGAIKSPIDKWGPWHVPDNKNEGTLVDVVRSVNALFTFDKIMDIFQYYTLFGTDKNYRKIKIACRYQQYEGANLIIERVKAGNIKRGLLWHFQGSGKSLLMIFAAQKLRMIPELKNPTVVIVDDRIQLEMQITSDFFKYEIPNLESADSKQKLIDFFTEDTRKILITTIFKFGEVEQKLNDRDNIIIMVDEAHRTQEGSLGEKMRLALPNAFYFGLTGTPINKVDRNTFYSFGAEQDESGYMSYYSFSDSIRDGATLPLHFETVPVDLKINKEVLDREFEILAKENNLSPDDSNNLARRVKNKVIFENVEHIDLKIAHMLNHFKSKIEPNSFKAQIVCYNRKCCFLYKKALDKLIPEHQSIVVMDTGDDPDGLYKEFTLDKNQEQQILDKFLNPDDDLKFVIVTAKLLTGFDAPVLQVMYLDKPMKDHTLLQAICRVNRVSGDTKSHGLIVDYVGIFDDMARALAFDEEGMRRVIKNIDEIKAEFPSLMNKCLSYFPNVDRTIEGYEGLINAQECLPTNEIKDKFAMDYGVLHKVYDIISPDPFLQPFKTDYVWLTKVFQSVSPSDGNGKLIWMALGSKTLEIVQQNINVLGIRDDSEIIELDAYTIDKFFEKNKSTIDGKKVKEYEIKLTSLLRGKKKEIKFIKLGERLEDIREKHEQGLVNSIEYLKLLLELARDIRNAEKEIEPEEEVDKGIQALTELFKSTKNDKTPIIVENIVKDIDKIVKTTRFDGWQNTNEGKREIHKQLKIIIEFKYKIKDDEVFEKACRYVETYY